MRLENYGYNVSSISRLRRSALGKAVQAVGYDRVRSALYNRKKRSNSYKFKRYRADLNWLKKKRKYV